jgi:AcrR family transcriptional regulator
MFKKVGIGVLIVMVAALSVAGVVLAQEPTPPADDAFSFGEPGTGAGLGMRRMDSRLGFGGGQPQALARALGIDVEQVHAALAETIAALAESQGMTLEDLVDALIAPAIERIQQAVEDERLTQEQADEQIAQTEERLLEGLESGSWFSMGGVRLPDRRGHDSRDHLSVEAIAEVLGLEVEDLQEALADGQTIAEVAEAQGVALEDVVDALMASASERLQQAVDDGRITQEQADEQTEQMEEHILQMLESGWRGGMRPGPGDFPGSPGRMQGRSQNDGVAGPRLPAQTAPAVDL